MASSCRGLIQWTSAYSVQIASIDNQHQLLVSIIRHLQEAMLDGRTKEIVIPLFEAMRMYTQHHFQFEEQLLKDHAYPELESHHDQHANLIRRIAELENTYLEGRLQTGAPIMHFLRTWLLNHIGAHDQEYAVFLKEKGVS